METKTTSAPPSATTLQTLALLERIAAGIEGNTALLESLLALQTAKPDTGAAEFAALNGAAEETEDEEFPFKQEHAENALTCPKCGSECWDNSQDREPGDKRPLVKCKNSDCDWRQWPARTRTGADSARANTKKARERTGRF